jgi:hypothetical protein
VTQGELATALAAAAGVDVPKLGAIQTWLPWTWGEGGRRLAERRYRPGSPYGRVTVDRAGPG